MFQNYTINEHTINDYNLEFILNNTSNEYTLQVNNTSNEYTLMRTYICIYTYIHIHIS